MVLKHFNPLISADLMRVMMTMGHGDEIVFADRNFPTVSRNGTVIPYNGVSIQPLLHAVLYHLPVDYAVRNPAFMMRIPEDSDYRGNACGDYQRILDTYHEQHVDIGYLERHDFYERASRAYAVVTTGETERFANIIIRKGIVRIGEEDYRYDQNAD